MTPELLAALGGAIVAILTPIFAMMRFFIKEFRPNGGSSVKDQLNRLENNMIEIKTMILDDRRRLDALENRKRTRKVQS
jgi:hypothetical protein